MTSSDALRNRACWDATARKWVEAGERAWAQEEPTWGIWHVPELRANGLEVLDLIELRAPEGAPPTRHGFVTPEWTRRWPCEEIWKARWAE